MIRTLRVTRELWRLSRPRTPTERRRARLVAAAVAGCGVAALVALAILTFRERRFVDAQLGIDVYAVEESLAPFLQRPEDRPEWALGAALLILPFALFGWQALRIGTAARERRLAALGLAGACPRQLRRLAAMEGTRAAVLGAILSGPAYLALWLVLGRLLPAGSRLLPEPDTGLAAGWVALVLVLGCGGALAAAATTRAVTSAPLGVARRAPRSGRTLWAPAPVIVASMVAALAALVVLWTDLTGVLVLRLSDLLVQVLAWGSLLVLVVTVAPWTVWGTARIAAGSGHVPTALAARRVLGDPRAGIRVASVLLAIGVAIGAAAVIVVIELNALQPGDPLSEGADVWVAALAAAALLTAAVATSSLLVGTREEVLDRRRSTAVLAAFGASRQVLTGVVLRQLLLVTIPPLLIGTFLGAGIGAFWVRGTDVIPAGLVALAVALVFAAGLGAGCAFVATAGIRSALTQAAVPENLRAT